MKTKYDTTMERIENLANGNDLMTTAMDLISREDAIRWVKTECNPYGKPTLDFESGKKVIEHLEQMPSAQPKPKTGHWIYDGDQIICNRCFKAFGFISLKLTSNYCPNCGSYNRGEQNETD